LRKARSVLSFDARRNFSSRHQTSAQLQEQAAQIQRLSAQLAAASPSDGALELNQFARQPAVTSE
jgi:hypothetical protein